MEEKKCKMAVEETRWMGGEKTSQTHGEAFYGQIGRKGGQKLKKLIEEGKEHEKNRIYNKCSLFQVLF